MAKTKFKNWITYDDADGYRHHKCRSCGAPALFYPEFEEDFDEDIDGEWFGLGSIQTGISEFITNFCPNCGLNMRTGKVLKNAGT